MNQHVTPSGTEGALERLVADHRAVEKLFDAFRPASESDDDARFTLVQRACEQWSVHSILEQELLYPAARQALGDDAALDIEASLVNHYLVRSLIERFATLTPAQPGFDATFRALEGLVRRHIEEEERKLFPRLRSGAVDLGALGRRLAARRAELDAKLDAAGSRSAGDRTLRFAGGDFPR